MTAITHFQTNREPNRKEQKPAAQGWRRLVAEDSLIWSSPFRLLLMFVILVLLVAAILVAVAF